MDTHTTSEQQNLTEHTRPGTVIIGAGHAGSTCAAMLRQYGYTGSITLIGDEDSIPYHRPPLSKGYLKGSTGADALKLRPDDFYVKQNIALKLARKVDGISLREKQLIMGHDTVDFDTLVIATGARARPLPCAEVDLAKVFELRTIADAQSLKRAGLQRGKKLVVIGGGYVGLEVAATARALGAQVVVLERAPRLLARVASQPLSAFFSDYHRNEGVEVLTDAQVTGMSVADDGRNDVQLADGTRISFDLAIVGIGALANDEIALAAGIECADGIVVDQQARTSVPGVYAIGDVTRRRHCDSSAAIRIESVQNAMEQAKQAAASIAGHAAPPPEVPWFWSEQYDLKLQIAGIADGNEDIVVRKGQDARQIAIFHVRDNRVVSVEAVNSPHEFMGGKQLIAQRTPVQPTHLRDAAIPMKDIINMGVVN